MPEQPRRTDRREPGASPAPRAPRRHRGLRALASPGSLTVAVLLGVLGFALSASTLDGSQDAVRDLSEAELVELLHDVEQHDDALDEQREQLRQQKAALEADDGSTEAQRQARQRAAELGILAGTVPASGEGIRMTVPGAEGVGAMTLLDAVQELRDAGAEAIQVNDQRIVASSWFLDAEEGRVLLDGQIVEPPFLIRAIGPAQTMATAMEIPGGVVESAQQQGSDIRLLRLDEVRVEATVPLER